MPVAENGVVTLISRRGRFTMAPDRKMPTRPNEWAWKELLFRPVLEVEYVQLFHYDELTVLLDEFHMLLVFQVGF